MFLYFTHISLITGAALLDSDQPERKKHRHKRERSYTYGQKERIDLDPECTGGHRNCYSVLTNTTKFVLESTDG